MHLWKFRRGWGVISTPQKRKIQVSRGKLNDIFPSKVGVWILILSAEPIHDFIVVKEKKICITVL